MSYPISLQDRAELAHEYAVNNGFWDGQTTKDANTLAAKLCLIHSETSEALEAARNQQYDYYEGCGGKPEGLIVELADIIIRVLDLAQALKDEGLIRMTIEQAVIEKMAFNNSRAYKHGGKTM